MLKSLVTASLSAVAFLSTQLGAAELIDVSKGHPVYDAENQHLELFLLDYVEDKRGNRQLDLTFTRRGGEWDTFDLEEEENENDRVPAANNKRSWTVATYPTLSFASDVAGSAVLEGTGSGDPVTLTLPLTGEMQAVEKVPADAKKLRGRFWRVKPRTPGELHTLEGTWKEGERSGILAGRVSPPLLPGHWNMGTSTPEGAIAFRFPMGSERMTWNWVQVAQYQFATPQDLTTARALKVHVETKTPRNDVELSLWLREEDGSWYYVKSAIPLVQHENVVDIAFSDLREAEWVAPGSHADEDYLFDRSAVTHLALGVVNSLGVGDVEVVLRGIETVAGPEPTPGTVTVTAGPDLLAVNGFDVVPAGVFGGYAPHLPQQYRPGCQRDLKPGSYPRVPRQRFAAIIPNGITDWKALLNVTQAEGPLKEHLSTLMGASKDWVHISTKYNLEKTIERAKKKNREVRMPKQLARIWTSLQRKRGLYDAAAWPKKDLPEDITTALAGIADLNDTEVMELHRHLLALTFPDIIKPLPEFGPTEAFNIDCFGERLERATMLWDPEWKANFEKYAETYAANGKRAGHVGTVEFWNEPYLNWAERSRVNLDSKSFVQEGVKAGDEVQVLYKDGSTGPVIPYFQWVEDPVLGGLKVIDTTTHSYWSGKGNGFIYDTMLGVMGPALKKADPNIKVIAGWGFRWHEGHWSPWDKIYKPTIDKNIEWIDGIHEHHYQGDTLAMNGAYEVLVAYAKTAHDKWLPVYNTETNDLVDAPARGRIDTPEKAKAASQYRKMVYNTRDILACLKESPDKLLARTMIHHDYWPEATEATFRFLRDLRGRLVHGTSSDEQVWVVASIDGTDPLAPSPHEQNHFVVAVFNDARAPRQVDVTLNVPTGTTLAGPWKQLTQTVDPESFVIGIDETDPEIGADGKVQVSLRERGATLFIAPISGDLNNDALVNRRQFFAADILQAIKADQPFATSVSIPANELASAKRAWLRLVVEDLATDEGTVVVGDQAIVLPKRMTADNINAILMLPLDHAKLSESNKVTFTLSDPTQAGYRVNMTSIVLE